MKAGVRARTHSTAASLAVAMLMAGAVHAQAAEVLSPALLGQLAGFVQNAYFNANSEMPKFPTDRAATQAEVLEAVAGALRVRGRPCTSVIGADYVDDSGNALAIQCTGGRYVVDAKRGRIMP